MKILKRGTLPPPPVWRGACHHCLTEVEAENREVDYENGEYNFPGYHYTICPVCLGRIMMSVVTR